MATTKPYPNLQLPDPLNFNKTEDVFSTQINSGNRKTQGIVTGRVTADSLNINGDVYIRGEFKLPISTASIILDDGTLAQPALRFKNDTDTGLYRSASGQIVLVANAQPVLTTSPSAILVNQQIATSAGNLILNPAGGAVDFSGAALINFSGISTNANFYDVAAPANVDTFGASTETILSIATDTNAVYTLEAKVSCLSITDGTSSASFLKIASVKNIAGVLTIVDGIQGNRFREAAIALADISFTGSGTTILLRATGVALVNIRWFGGVRVTRMKV